MEAGFIHPFLLNMFHPYLEIALVNRMCDGLHKVMPHTPAWVGVSKIRVITGLVGRLGHAQQWAADQDQQQARRGADAVGRLHVECTSDPDARRISSKSQRLLVIGYLLVVTSWLFTVPPYISPVFVINYSCSYCGSSRSADSEVKALFEVTPCSAVMSLQRPVEHNLEGSVEIWAYNSRKGLIHSFDR